MRHSLDAAIAIMLLALAAAVAASAISIKAGSTAQALAIAAAERDVIAQSEFALSHCPPKGIAVCRDGEVAVNNVVSLPLPSAANATGFCINRLVLFQGIPSTAVFCQNELD